MRCLRGGEQVARALLAAAFCVALSTQLTALAPSRSASPEFTSDAAVPVLMANDAHWDAFRLYYYGQDRYGAWPFWIAHLLRRLFGFSWTPDSLHVWQALWLISGILPAMLLSRRRPVVGGGAFLLAIGLPGLARSVLSDSQPYAWQVPALLWAWWSLRAWVEPPPRRGRASIATVLQFLAIWISTVSVPLLAVLGLLEVWRLRLAQRLPASLGRSAARALVPVALGAAAELGLRTFYHRAALARFGGTFTTHLRFDWGHLASNLAAVSHRLIAGESWPALTLTTLGALFVGWTLRRKVPLDAEALELCTWTLGLTALAVLPIPVLVCVSHVRINLFSDRFFAPTLCFAQAAAVAGATLAATALAPRTRAWIQPALAAGTLVVLIAARPQSTPNAVYERESRTAAALVERAPGSPLIDGYSRAYLYAALAPAGSLLAVPTEGDYGRTPFDLGWLRAAPTIVVGNAGSLARSTGAPSLSEYGIPLRLLQPALYTDGSETFALYKNATSRQFRP